RDSREQRRPAANIVARPPACNPVVAVCGRGREPHYAPNRLPWFESLLPRRPRGFAAATDLSVAGADGGFSVAAVEGPCASAGTWPSENSMSRRMPALTARACRNGRPPPSRPTAQPP